VTYVPGFELPATVCIIGLAVPGNASLRFLNSLKIVFSFPSPIKLANGGM